MNKNQIFKNVLPHAIAVAVFLLVTVIFCKPALSPDVILSQGDVTGWQGMSHQAMQYKEVHGHYPLWVTNMFGGMPAYQIAMEGSWSPLAMVDKVIQFGLPQPFNFFFLACICFYFLCICLGIRPYVAIMGAVAFAFCSYNPIIVTAGHNTKMLALAYAPAVLGAAILIFDKKYLLGFALMALLTSLQIAQGHQQITYYLFLVLGAMGLSYLIRFIRSKDFRHILKSSGLIILSVVLGLATNALVLMTTYDYTKDSKRGGQLVMKGEGKTSDVVEGGKTQGLSKDYAFQWSYGQAETWSLMFPGVKGCGFHYAVNESGEPSLFPKLGENSHVYRYFSENVQGVDPNQAAMSFSRNLYWGDQPFTNGPVYLGAIVCFLFIVGMFYLDGKHKWWILATTAFAIMLAWGSHFPSFNYFMFDHFPFYNKFRVPTLALVIPQLLVPVIGVLVIDQITKDKAAFSWKTMRMPLFFTLGVFVLIFGFYLSSDFSSENPDYMKNYEAYNKTRAQYEAEMNGLNQKFQDSIKSAVSTGLPVDQVAIQNYFTESAKKIDATYTPELDKLGKALNATPSGRDDQLRTDENISNLAAQLNKNPNELSNGIVQAIREDRGEMFFNDILHSLLWVVLAAALLICFMYFNINPILLAAGLAILIFADLYSFDVNYLNASNFVSKETYEQNSFPLTAADNQILADNDPNFRVFDPAGMESSAPSYYHKAIGGYHPAKLGIYDDLMKYQLPANSPNERVLDMLNAKYKIKDQNTAERRASALGNVWFVKGVKFVKGPEEEMKALDNFNPLDTAIVDETFKSRIGNFAEVSVSEDTIKQTSFDNDAITYETNTVAPHLAVFSEIYYKDWKAYVDGQPADFVKCNYVLRAMVVPAGKHKIEFKFEPKVYFTGKKIAAVSSWLVLLILLGSIAFPMIRTKSKNVSKA